MQDVDVNALIKAVADGKLSVQDYNYILNTTARFTERVNDSETH